MKPLYYPTRVSETPQPCVRPAAAEPRRSMRCCHAARCASESPVLSCKCYSKPYHPCVHASSRGAHARHALPRHYALRKVL